MSGKKYQSEIELTWNDTINGWEHYVLCRPDITIDLYLDNQVTKVDEGEYRLYRNRGRIKWISERDRTDRIKLIITHSAKKVISEAQANIRGAWIAGLCTLCGVILTLIVNSVKGHTQSPEPTKIKYLHTDNCHQLQNRINIYQNQVQTTNNEDIKAAAQTVLNELIKLKTLSKCEQH